MIEPVSLVAPRTEPSRSREIEVVEVSSGEELLLALRIVDCDGEALYRAIALLAELQAVPDVKVLGSLYGISIPPSIERIRTRRPWPS